MDLTNGLVTFEVLLFVVCVGTTSHDSDGIHLSKRTAIRSSEILDIRDSVAKFNPLDDLLTRLSAAEERLAHMELHYTKTQKDLRRPKAHRLKKDVRVAFTASLTHTIHGLSPGSIIAFDDVSINLESGYDNSNGIFTCPANGHYFIMASLMSGFNNKIYAEIVLDNTHKAAIYAQSNSPSLNAQSSNSVVTHCSIGQRIWVNVKQGSSVYGETSSPLTQFTGYLIWED